MITHCPKDLVAYHPRDGLPPTVYCSPPIPGMVITFPSTVTHNLQGGKLDLEFDSSAAQLVNLVVSIAQLVYPSVTLPAKLVYFTSTDVKAMIEEYQPY